MVVDATCHWTELEGWRRRKYAMLAMGMQLRWLIAPDHSHGPAEHFWRAAQGFEERFTASSIERLGV